MFLKVKQSGQTIIELIVVITIGIIILSALVFAIMSSLRNAQFSKNQLQATKFAQEAIEKIRVIRDRNIENKVVYTYSGGYTSKFSDLWDHSIRDECGGALGYCIFALDSTDLELRNVVYKETLNGGFQRETRISDESISYKTQKIITVVVSWVDFSGSHESKLSTILAKY